MSNLILSNVRNIEQLKEANLQIVQKLKQERLTANFSEVFMAEWLEISRGKLREFERGKIDFELMIRYAEKFGVDLSIILNFEE